ncbi:uracil-DNA glycosylase family protein [Bacteriovorax sp. BAL6_X]|uniref:uracil-DNA glycosylase n=1 Tax=Bacteriovorax sp. BAL6_X TaxID=1201290 RepID=UPI000385467F|nr:uracil-DNA glycosylase [Bacteriovorax sp. BAL6_X]EPZ49784.1 uracil-DNA glycosylase family protein [Bacteriovorax sp. BAL6_X]
MRKVESPFRQVENTDLTKVKTLIVGLNPGKDEERMDLETSGRNRFVGVAGKNLREKDYYEGMWNKFGVGEEVFVWNLFDTYSSTEKELKEFSKRDLENAFFSDYGLGTIMKRLVNLENIVVLGLHAQNFFVGQRRVDKFSNWKSIYFLRHPSFIHTDKEAKQKIEKALENPYLSR